MAGIAFNALFLFWAVGHLIGGSALHFGPVHLALTTAGVLLFWACCAVALWNIVADVIVLSRPRSITARPLFQMINAAAGGLVCCWFLKAGSVAAVTLSGSDATRNLAITHQVNLWMTRAFPFAVFAIAVMVMAYGYQLWLVTQLAPGELPLRA